ncbi:hypothetical protein ABIF69_007926 [Bradyrhizobium japonicum]
MDTKTQGIRGHSLSTNVSSVGVKLCKRLTSARGCFVKETSQKLWDCNFLDDSNGVARLEWKTTVANV